MCSYLKSSNVSRISKSVLTFIYYYNSIKHLCSMSVLTLHCNCTVSRTASASKDYRDLGIKRGSSEQLLGLLAAAKNREEKRKTSRPEERISV